MFSCISAKNRAFWWDPRLVIARSEPILPKGTGDMTRSFDALVLGAGIVGVSTALHLQACGRSVALLDRRVPGSETSHGNAGLIERSSVIPYAFPRSITTLLVYASNRSIAVRYRPAYLARLLPWLARYWWHSSVQRVSLTAREMLPLIERCIDEHEIFIGPAGIASLMRNEGWIDLHRSPRAFDRAVRSVGELADFSLEFDVLDAAALGRREPALRGGLAGAVHWRDPMTVSDPGGVTRAYAELFISRGGQIVDGDAQRLSQESRGWRINGQGPGYSAPDVVVALGPWSAELCRRFGYRFPFAYKRGYHMHYEAEGESRLLHPLCDSEAGFVLAPMARGIRLTTGIELADRDATSDVRQITLAENVARGDFPLGAAIDASPWRGARLCLPDMKPIIGQAPRHKGLWLALGHAHHGFTLGSVTVRLLAEQITGGEAFTDPRPYAPNRFRA